MPTAADLRERPDDARAPRGLPCSSSPITPERNTGCGTAGGAGAVRSGGDDAVEDETMQFSIREPIAVSTSSPFSIGAVVDSKEVKECASRLVDELKVDLRVARRFARAREGDFSEAKEMLEDDLAWRAKMIPVMQADCPTVLASGAWRMLGYTSSLSSLLSLQVLEGP